MAAAWYGVDRPHLVPVSKRGAQQPERGCCLGHHQPQRGAGGALAEQARLVKTVKAHVTPAGVHGSDRRLRTGATLDTRSLSTGSPAGCLGCAVHSGCGIMCQQATRIGGGLPHATPHLACSMLVEMAQCTVRPWQVHHAYIEGCGMTARAMLL